MSRSFRHEPFAGVTTAESDKRDKVEWNRKLRKAAGKRLDLSLSTGDNDMAIDTIHPRKEWFNKDGHHRFDPNQYPRDMRK